MNPVSIILPCPDQENHMEAKITDVLSFFTLRGIAEFPNSEALSSDVLFLLWVCV